MSKLAISIAVMMLAGCASGWRTLTIDGSSESAFGDSVLTLNEELSTTRSRYFAIALNDIAFTGMQAAGRSEDGSSTYTHEDFRADLDGLAYKAVIDLADETGRSVRSQYTWSRPAPTVDGAPFYDPTRGRPTFTTDGRPMSDVRPHGRDWPTGADGRGNAVYGNR